MPRTSDKDIIQPIGHDDIEHHLSYLRILLAVQQRFTMSDFVTRKKLSEKRIVSRSIDGWESSRQNLVTEKITRSISFYENIHRGKD